MFLLPGYEPVTREHHGGDADPWNQTDEREIDRISRPGRVNSSMLDIRTCSCKMLWFRFQLLLSRSMATDPLRANFLFGLLRPIKIWFCREIDVSVLWIWEIPRLSITLKPLFLSWTKFSPFSILDIPDLPSISGYPYAPRGPPYYAGAAHHHRRRRCPGRVTRFSDSVKNQEMKLTNSGPGSRVTRLSQFFISRFSDVG